MTEETDWINLSGELRVFAKLAFSSLIGGVFLAIWVYMQWYIDKNVISRFTLTGLDAWVLTAFQWIFAISTLAPVIVYIFVDIARMFYRARRVLRDLQESSSS